jgi:hypothetical protein
MAILDLQGMQAPTTRNHGGGKSGASKGCTINTGGNGGGASFLSVLLC